MGLTPAELLERRIAAKVSLLDLAAHTGLPSAFIEQIEKREVVALASDVTRLARAVDEIAAERTSRRGRKG